MSWSYIVYFLPVSDCVALGQVIRHGFCSLPQGLKKTSPATTWISGLLTFNTSKKNPPIFPLKPAFLCRFLS